MTISDRHLCAALDYIGRCLDAGDSRPVIELLEEILSPRDARLVRDALIDFPARPGP